MQRPDPEHAGAARRNPTHPGNNQSHSGLFRAAPLALPGAPWSVRAGAALALALTTLDGLLVNRWLDRSAREVWLWPVAIVVLAFGAVRSAWLALLRGGIVWRGTHYSSAALRAGRRVRFP